MRRHGQMSTVHSGEQLFACAGACHAVYFLQCTPIPAVLHFFLFWKYSFFWDNILKHYWKIFWCVFLRKFLRMEEAISAVRDSNMSISAASRIFKVPRTTLSERLRGSTGKKGRPLKFTPEEEAILVDVLLKCANAGVGLNKRWFKKIVAKIADCKGACSAAALSRLIDWLVWIDQITQWSID